MLALLPSVECNLIRSSPLAELLLSLANTSLYASIVCAGSENPIGIEAISVDALFEKELIYGMACVSIPRNRSGDRPPVHHVHEDRRNR